MADTQSLVDFFERILAKGAYDSQDLAECDALLHTYAPTINHVDQLHIGDKLGIDAPLIKQMIDEALGVGDDLIRRELQAFFAQAATDIRRLNRSMGGLGLINRWMPESMQFDEYLNHLLAMPKSYLPGQVPPLVMWIEQIAVSFSDSGIVTSLQEWVLIKMPQRFVGLTREQIIQFRTQLLPQSVSSGARNTYVMIELDYADQTQIDPVDRLYALDVQIQHYKNDIPQKLAGFPISPVALKDIYSALETTFVKLFRDREDGEKVVIELFVPTDAATLVGQIVEEWVADDGFEQQPIANDFIITLRPLERLRGSKAVQGNLWRKRWVNYQAHAQDGACASTIWLAQNQCNDIKAIYHQIKNNTDITCVALGFEPSAHPKILLALVAAGVPIAFWPKPCAHVGHGHAHVCGQITQVFGDEPMHRMPAQIRDARKRASDDKEMMAHHVALMWDDPNRVLPKYSKKFCLPE